MTNKGGDWRDKVYVELILEEVGLAELEPVYKSKGPSGTVLKRTRITIPPIEVTTTTEVTATTRVRENIRASSRWTILNRDGFRCYYCGRSSKDGANLHIDHVIPLARGGMNDIGNLITACEQCNLGKSTDRCLNEAEVLTDIMNRNEASGIL